MNLKRVFGTLLTLLGIVGLVFAANTFMETNGGKQDIKSLIIYGLLGTMFFFTGINLVSTTKDEA